MITTSLRRASTRSDRAYQISKHRASFARRAVFLEFRRRDAAAIDFDGFVDRRANETPRLAPEAWRRETRKQKSWGRVA